MKLSLTILVLSALFTHALPIDGRSSHKGGSSSLQSILNRADSSELYHYPTDLTQDITPVLVHSHNDYWRPVPFYTALSVGSVSVEADVFLVNRTLYIGHERTALTPTRTLDSLYIQPLLDVLRRQNPASAFVTSPERAHGVFDTAASQTFYLWVDVKTNGTETWPYVVQALQPLREVGYLTRLNSSGVIENGPVTVIGTGNTPLNQIQTLTQRDYFWDAPVATLGTSFSNITSNVSPIASTNFAAQFGMINGTAFNETQLARLRSQIAVASSKNIRVRYWETPSWPVSVRNTVWKTLVSEGVGLLNADDLGAAAGHYGENSDW
ncbi:hypothetical protein GJ744_010441 [Endocarpon pusillum]|uniref:Altered inheritance of mitochondria protein 6 n=1 Tax=Endocarpon pusillum TaxID=364733 RepID=A0A8H7AE93_9EURO|nr:hypothetical protein GJ744_010441 [Endocarpon pusillum]